MTTNILSVVVLWITMYHFLPWDLFGSYLSVITFKWFWTLHLLSLSMLIINVVIWGRAFETVSCTFNVSICFLSAINKFCFVTMPAPYYGRSEVATFHKVITIILSVFKHENQNWSYLGPYLKFILTCFAGNQMKESNLLYSYTMWVCRFCRSKHVWNVWCCTRGWADLWGQDHWCVSLRVYYWSYYW